MTDTPRCPHCGEPLNGPPLSRNPRTKCRDSHQEDWKR